VNVLLKTTQNKFVSVNQDSLVNIVMMILMNVSYGKKSVTLAIVRTHEAHTYAFVQNFILVSFDSYYMFFIRNFHFEYY
jgi:hypothetical protein